MPCPCRGLEKSLSERHVRSTGRARHGQGMACVNQKRPHCVNQMRKTQSKPLAARHGRGTAWARHFMCELALSGGRAMAQAISRRHLTAEALVQCQAILCKR
jgi:hypothetical protein